MSERKCIVTTKLGVDIDAFVAEMNSLGRESVHVPERAVEVSDIMMDSGVNTEFMLTDAERTELLNDDRVIDAVWSDQEIRAIPRASAGNITYNRGGTFIAAERPWSWASCTNTSNPFGSNSSDPLTNQTRNYTLTGAGVDVVVIDSGIQADHPEWLTIDGTASRFQRIDWTSPTFAAGNVANAANMYTDIDGHGTACHSALAGRRYGWAPGANIYSLSIPTGTLNPNSTFGSSLTAFTYPFQRLNVWHMAKPIQSTGYRRPTIVSMSWGFPVMVADLTNYGSSNITGSYRGASFSYQYNNTNSANLGNIGILSSGGSYAISDVLAVGTLSAVDTEIAACMANGIIFVSAAGNDTLKIDVSGGADYDNYADNPFGGAFGTRAYYHRGGTPITSGAITVGGVSSTYNVTNGLDNKANFSRSGPGVAVYSPAVSLPLAISNVEAQAGSPVPYPDNPNYNAIKISGTSFAGPTVAGWLATMAEARPYLNQAMAQQLVEQTAVANRLATLGNTYTANFYLNGGNNRYLYNPFNSDTVSIVESDGNINIGGTF